MAASISVEIPLIRASYSEYESTMDALPGGARVALFITIVAALMLYVASKRLVG
jgi:hypothetical protein